MKKAYSAQLAMVREIFPDWTDVDLLFALAEADGDVETTIERVAAGTSHWSAPCSALFYLSIYLPACLPVYLSTCLPTYLPTCPSTFFDVLPLPLRSSSPSLYLVNLHLNLNLLRPTSSASVYLSHLHKSNHR